MKPIIEVNNLYKKYRYGLKQPYYSFRDTLVDLAKSPFRQKARLKKAEFWALKDISFKVMPGEVIGIIGRNGAGKSTLLKILSRITPPTKGEVILRGRVASLLEVGTGFSPELTGRENIYLNGAILGMRRAEIIKKFNEIVEFAEISKFLDTPVKFYSSGMYMRLAFAIAAHLEPEILLVDEVLAVGDVEFQNKCLGKMKEVSKAGRTILFVSHNMGAIRQLCSKVILLKEGEVEITGETGEVVETYLNNSISIHSITNYENEKRKDAQIIKISILNSQKIPSPQIRINECCYVEIEYEIKKTINHAVLALVIYSITEELLLVTTEGDKSGKSKTYEKGKYKGLVTIPPFLFNVGNYYFDVSIQNPFVEYFDLKKNIGFEIINASNPKHKILKGNNLGKISTILDYCIKKS